jgi:CheY-like chemotaxis protein
MGTSPSGVAVPHILWAEDDDGDRALIQEAIRQLPYPPETEFVRDGTELLARLADDTPGLVVVDLGMPGMGGLEAIGRVRVTAKKRVPVVVFTGHDDRSEAEACRKAGAADVVQKPTDFNSFRSAVQRIVTHTRW